MPSYQDIETRLRVVEDKVDILMRSIKITKVERPTLIGGDSVTVTKSLLDIYREMKGLGQTAEQLDSPVSEANNA